MSEIPKSFWGDGPWQSEPDRLEWKTRAGLPGLIVRGPVGALCGYAAVTKDHPLYEIPYSGCARGHKPVSLKTLWRRARRACRRAKTDDQKRMAEFTIRWLRPGLRRPHFDCTNFFLKKRCTTPENIFSVHGGITYSGACHGAICHTPAPGEPDRVWWFGFDCAHYMDVSPGIEASLRMFSTLSPRPSRDETYRDIDYVKAEVENLAQQLVDFQKDKRL